MKRGTAVRLLVCAAVTAVLWWGGWAALIVFAWAIILGPPVLRWFGGKMGNLYTPPDSQFRIRPEYSIAEGRAAVGRYREAIEQFRSDIEKFPDEVTPHVRIAEILLDQFGNVDAGIAELQTARSKAKGEDAFVLVVHRLADAYLQRKGDATAAITCLDEILQRYPHSKHALGARHRIQSLTAS